MKIKANVEKELSLEMKLLMNTRRGRLASLRYKFKSDAALARYYGLAPGYYSLIKNGKPMGEDRARYVEMFINEPRYWLDGVADGLYALKDEELSVVTGFRLLDEKLRLRLLTWFDQHRDMIPESAPRESIILDLFPEK